MCSDLGSYLPRYCDLNIIVLENAFFVYRFYALIINSRRILLPFLGNKYEFYYQLPAINKKRLVALSAYQGSQTGYSICVAS